LTPNLCTQEIPSLRKLHYNLNETHPSSDLGTWETLILGNEANDAMNNYAFQTTPVQDELLLNNCVRACLASNPQWSSRNDIAHPWQQSTLGSVNTSTDTCASTGRVWHPQRNPTHTGEATTYANAHRLWWACRRA